ncbi:MAG TPA: SGNH/GDSL hydrolase family protein [Candidatus Saccharimonadales bacterium]|nr:SGNH/GDSL hydrolase family protein [Candidatus Saccharimonadales bacterium]
MRRIRPRGGVRSALLIVFCLVAASLVSAQTAVANSQLQFTLEASSVRIGGTVRVTEVDPCPPPVVDDMGTSYGYVSFTLRDANGVTQGGGRAELDPNGHWGQALVGVSARSVVALNPPAYREAPSPGQGFLMARCVVPGVNDSYIGQNLSLTGSSAHLVVGTGTVGKHLHITPSEPCPMGATQAYVLTDDEDTNNLNQSVTVNADGSWEMDLNIPDWHPAHRISIAAGCVTAGFSYDGVIAELVYDSHRYVAMGDSYSAGVGTFNYDASSGSCMRSPASYASYVASQRENMGTPYFVACGGATTADLYGQNPSTGEPRQLDALTHDTRYVTLTVGGNDVGFKEVMERCANWFRNSGWGCANDTTLRGTLTQRFAALAGTATATSPDGRQITPLAGVFSDIAAASPGVKIYVGGYPRLFGASVSDYTSNSSAPGGAQCIAATGMTISFSDAQWLNQLADDLNGIISNAVDEANVGGANVAFVDPGLFNGHGLCDSDTAWINGVVLDSSNNPQAESMHPTAEGYSVGYGPAFAAMVN